MYTLASENNGKSRAYAYVGKRVGETSPLQWTLALSAGYIYIPIFHWYIRLGPESCDDIHLYLLLSNAE